MINAKKMSDSGIKLAIGTDAGNPAVFFGPSVHREMELMVKAGISPAEVLKAATINAAEILGKGDQLGTISKGKLADILVVDGNPLTNIQSTQNIHMVIKNGKILDRAELARRINPPENPSSPPKVKETTKKDKTLPSTDLDSTTKKQIIEAKKTLKTGVNTWDPDLMKKARDRLLGLVIKAENGGFYPVYYTALCDYRLATYYLTLGQMDHAEPYIKEGQDYLKKAMELEPDFGELDAFYAYMLGFEMISASWMLFMPTCWVLKSHSILKKPWSWASRAFSILAAHSKKAPIIPEYTTLRVSRIYTHLRNTEGERMPPLEHSQKVSNCLRKKMSKIL
jgi:hypothetical protein